MLGRLLNELRRRKVLAVLAAYAVGAYAIVSAASLIVPALALPDWITSLLLVSAIAMAPIVLYLSWYFEFTPRGLVRVSGESSTARPRPLTWVNWLSLAVITAGAVGFGFLVFDEVRARKAGGKVEIAAPEEKSLAVMVFRDLSPDQDLGYLAEGLAEELSSALGKTPGLQVTAVGSTRRFAERSDSPAAIGTELGVSTLLEGSVRLEGSRLLVTANLVDAASGKTRWSERFARPFDEIFKVQQEIVQSILNRIMDDYVVQDGARIVGQETSTDAYVMYLQGRQQFRLRTAEAIKQARKYFEQAVGLDTEYAPAYVGIADSVRFLAKGLENYGDIDPAIAARVAKENIDKALLRDPELPEAYASLGNVALLEGRNDDALAAFDKAIQLNPNYADAHLWRFLVLRNMARNADALASLETAKALDPLSRVILKNWAIEKARSKDPAAALAVFDKLIKLDRDSPVGYKGAAQVAYSSGDLVRSAEYYHEVLKRSPDTEQFRLGLGDVFMIAGLPEAAAKLLDEDVYKVNLVIAGGDYPRALEMIRFAHAAQPDDPLLTFEHAWYEMLWGEREKGRELLRSVDKTILSTGWFDQNFCSPHIEMAYAFPAGADRERWLATCRKYVTEQAASGYSNAELSYMTARVAALDGDRAVAAKALVEAVEAGWRQPWTRYDPLLADIMGEPAAKQALQKLSQSLDSQRTALDKLARRWGYIDAASTATP